MPLRSHITKNSRCFEAAEQVGTTDPLAEFLLGQVIDVLALQQLPPHHKDPFDRLIIAQALSENVAVVSVDTMFPQYPVTVLA